MTIVCWDGVTLAADKSMHVGRTMATTTKIFRVFDELVGLAGDVSLSMELLNWFREGADPLNFPPENRDPSKGATMLVINNCGVAREYVSGPYPVVYAQTQAAIGCGDESAYVAMACGLDARAAVEMVCRFNSGCGGGVDTLTLNRSKFA